MNTIKKILTVVVGVAALASCSDTLDVSEIGGVPADGEAVPMEFTAIKKGDNGASRVSLASGSYNVVWSANDSISVFDIALSNRRFDLSSGSGKSMGTFSGSAVMNAFKHYAIYPYNKNMKYTNQEGVVSGVTLPQVQYKDNNIDPKAAIMMASTDQYNDLAFVNCCAVLKLTLNYNCDSIVVIANEAETLAGTVTMDYNDGKPRVKKVEKGVSTVRYVAPSKGLLNSGESHVRYIALLPGELKSGFTIAACRTATHTMYYYGTSKDITLEPGKVYPMSLDYTNAPGIPTVDLGNGIEMSVMNYGALSLTDPGFYYAFGEVATKDSYAVSNYKYNTNKTADDWSQAKISKYVPYSYFGHTMAGVNDNKLSLDDTDDIICKTTYGNQCIPSYWDMMTLSEYVTPSSVTIEGKNCYKITSSITNKSIIIPPAGYMENEDLTGTTMCAIMTSSVCPCVPKAGHTPGWSCVYTANSNYLGSHFKRHLGFPVRGIKYNRPVDLGLPSGTLWATSNMVEELAWGQIDFSDEEYRWKADGWGNYGKYNEWGAELELEDDAAYLYYGAGYRIPSNEQFSELFANTTVTTYDTYNKYTSKINGKSITLQHVTYSVRKLWERSKEFLDPVTVTGYNGDEPQPQISARREHKLAIRPVYEK